MHAITFRRKMIINVILLHRKVTEISFGKTC